MAVAYHAEDVELAEGVPTAEDELAVVVNVGGVQVVVGAVHPALDPVLNLVPAGEGGLRTACAGGESVGASSAEAVESRPPLPSRTAGSTRRSEALMRSLPTPTGNPEAISSLLIRPRVYLWPCRRDSSPVLSMLATIVSSSASVPRQIRCIPHIFLRSSTFAAVHCQPAFESRRAIFPQVQHLLPFKRSCRSGRTHAGGSKRAHPILRRELSNFVTPSRRHKVVTYRRISAVKSNFGRELEFRP